MEDHGSDNVCVRSVRPWQYLMVVNLKTDSTTYRWEGVIKQVLAGSNSDAKGSLHPKFERCRNTSVKWHNWRMHDLQLHNLEGVLLLDRNLHMKDDNHQITSMVVPVWTQGGSIVSDVSMWLGEI